MKCDRCSREAIIYQRYSGLHLCESHFQDTLVARAKRTIRAHGWIQTGDRIAIALSGGMSSSSLLHFLSVHFGMRRDLSLVAITVDEGTGPCRDMGRIKRTAEGMGVGWAGTSFAEEFGITPEMGNGHIPGSCRGILRGHALTSLASRVGATKLALGTNLDDEAGSVLQTVLRGEAAGLMCHPRLGNGRIPLVRPFLRIPGQEVALYALLNVPGPVQEVGPHAPDKQGSETWRILAEYTNRHPAAPFSLVHLSEALSEMEGHTSREPYICERCSGPCVPSCPARGILDQVTGHG
ncbi:MAG: ATP-binding protein [Methanomicrobiales archaeon]|jgi:tRNA(Ile)-lysidine synthase TilS/MesJ